MGVMFRERNRTEVLRKPSTPREDRECCVLLLCVGDGFEGEAVSFACEDTPV